MNTLKLIILLSLVVITPVLSANNPAIVDTFSTGRYSDNQTLRKTLTIPDVDELEVTVSGETERNFDVVTIYDSNKQQIRRLSGVINEKFVVSGSTIHVLFRSDGRKTGEGVTVKIMERLVSSVFNEIKKQLLDAAIHVLRRGTSQIYVEITQNTNKFRNLRDRITKVRDIEPLITEVTAELLAISQTYNRIANQSSDVIAGHQTQLGIIKTLKSRTLSNIDKVEKKRQNYVTMLDRDQSVLEEISDSMEKQKIQVSIEGYKSIIHNLETQQAIWNSFYEAQDTLETKLAQHSEKIQMLLHFLGVNAQVYEQAANIALLRKTTVVALDKLTDLAELQRIVNEIDSSEREIQQWLDRIQRTDFKL